MNSGVASNASRGDKLEQRSPCGESTCGETDCLQQARCSSCGAQNGASQVKSAKDIAIMRFTLHNFAKLRRLALKCDLFILPTYAFNVEDFTKGIRGDPMLGPGFDDTCEKYKEKAATVAYEVAKQVTKDVTEEERTWAKRLREKNDELRRREKIQEQARARREELIRRDIEAAERVKQEMEVKHEQPRQGFAAMSREAQKHLIAQHQAQLALQKQQELQAAVEMTIQPASDRIGNVSAVPTLNNAQNHTRKSYLTLEATSTPPQGVKSTFPWSWKQASTVPQQPSDTRPYNAPPNSPNQTASHPELSRASTTTSSTLLPYHHLNPQTTYPSQQVPAISKCSHISCRPIQTCNLHSKALEATILPASPENHVPSTISNLHTISPKATINNSFRAALKSSSTQATTLPPAQDPINAVTAAKIDTQSPLPTATSYGQFFSSRDPVSTIINTPAVALRPKGESKETDRPRESFFSSPVVTPRLKAELRDTDRPRESLFSPIAMAPRPIGEIKDTDRPCETFFSAPAVAPKSLFSPPAVAPRPMGEIKDTDRPREILSFFSPSADRNTSSVPQPPTASPGPSSNPNPAPQQKATIQDSFWGGCRGNFKTEKEKESFRRRGGSLLEDLTDNDDFAMVKTSDIEDDTDWDIINHSDGAEVEPVNSSEPADVGGSVKRDWDTVIVSGKGWRPVDVNGMGVWGTG